MKPGIYIPYLLPLLPLSGLNTKKTFLCVFPIYWWEYIHTLYVYSLWIYFMPTLFNNRNFMKKVLLATWTLRDRYIVIEGLYTESTFFVKLAVPDCLAAAWMKLWGGQMSGGKSLYFSQGCQYRKKVWNQSQKKSAWKRPIFGCTLIQAV